MLPTDFEISIDFYILEKMIELISHFYSYLMIIYIILVFQIGIISTRLFVLVK